MKKIAEKKKKKSSSPDITQEIVLNENITAPIQKDDILGTVHFYLDNELLDSVNLVAKNEVKKLSIVSMYSDITEKWINLLR